MMRRLAPLVAAALVAIVAFFLLSGPHPGQHTEPAVYGPPYADPSHSDHANASDVDVPDVERRENIAGRRTSVGNVIRGRVLWYDDSPADACTVTVRRRGATQVTARVSCDAAGHFSIDVDSEANHEEGQSASYHVIATAPGAAMFPYKPRIGIPGGQPVRIYLHRAFQMALRVRDEESRQVLAVPNLQVEVQIDERIISENTRSGMFEGLMDRGMTRSDIVDIGARRIVRILGTDDARALERTGFATIRCGAPYCAIDAVDIPDEQLSTRASVVDVFAKPRGNAIPVFLQTNFRDGGPMEQSVFLVLEGRDRQLAFGAQRLHPKRLVYLERGDWRGTFGTLSSFQATSSISVSSRFETLSLTCERGGTIVLKMLEHDASLAPYRRAGVSQTGSLPEEVSTGHEERTEPFIFRNLPSGRYRVFATDSTGTKHETIVEVTPGSRETVSFRVSD